MATHKCKLCTRSFPNGRALGGHMKAHLATLPLPAARNKSHQVFQSSASTSSSSSSEDNNNNKTGSTTYVLRENPKRSLKFSDPDDHHHYDHLSIGSVIVQDRESETESKSKSTVNKKHRSNRNWKLENKKLKSSDFDESPSKPMSSVSDNSEEDVAICLMMLSRDIWVHPKPPSTAEVTVSININSKVKGKIKCDNCKKMFRSTQALGSHKRVCLKNHDVAVMTRGHDAGDESIFECPFCDKVFGSGQALGGHKRSHLILPSSIAIANCSDLSKKNNLIDLNLPAPLEDDEFSVVSDL
ncbi:hypothetical protein ACFE04_027592 [Oxalis oulophora]